MHESEDSNWPFISTISRLENERRKRNSNFRGRRKKRNWRNGRRVGRDQRLGERRKSERRQRRQSGVKWKSEHGHVGYLRCVAGLSIRGLMLDYGRGGNLCRPSAGIKACSQRPPRHRQPATGYSLWISRVNGRASAPSPATSDRVWSYHWIFNELGQKYPWFRAIR